MESRVATLTVILITPRLQFIVNILSDEDRFADLTVKVIIFSNKKDTWNDYYFNDKR